MTRRMVTSLHKQGLALHIIFPHHMNFPLANKTQGKSCCGEISCEMPVTQVYKYQISGISQKYPPSNLLIFYWGKFHAKCQLPIQVTGISHEISPANFPAYASVLVARVKIMWRGNSIMQNARPQKTNKSHFISENRIIRIDPGLKFIFQCGKNMNSCLLDQDSDIVLIFRKVYLQFLQTTLMHVFLMHFLIAKKI